MQNETTRAPATLILDDAAAEELKRASIGYASLTLSLRQACDLELLLNGGFAPLTGFMGREAYEGVLDDMRLPDGAFWPMPITFDVKAEFAEKLTIGQRIALRDAEGFMPAVLEVEEIWTPDKRREALAVFGTDSLDHPGVAFLFNETQETYIGGRVIGAQLPAHSEFETLWNTPQELRRTFEKMGWRRVIAFHTTNPLHRVHREVIFALAKEKGANVLLHPAVGITKPGDLHYYARVHCYKAIQHHFPHNLAVMSLLPLAMRMAGPREALWHAVVNANFGCTHFVVGPDHASPPNGTGSGFYPKYAAQEQAIALQAELGIEVCPVQEWQYVPAKGRFLPEDAIQQQGLTAEGFTDADLKQALACDREVPEWVTYPSVLKELARVYPPRRKQGFTLFFTGLSGSGKSTIARILFAKLIESGERPVSLLDGDIVRQHLSSELGFSKVHRDLNIRRIGFVASEITKNGGVAICAPIAPYMSTRRAVRSMIEGHGAFIEVHVATPLEVCEGRDRKGLYAKARKGLIPEFTGISDPYETPENPEVRIDTSLLNPAQAAQEVVLYLLREGFLDARE